MTKYMRLYDNHPTVKKVEKVFQLMEELNLAFNIEGNMIQIIDKENLPEARLGRIVDVEKNMDDYDCGIYQLPPEIEYKIGYPVEDIGIGRDPKKN